MREFVSAVNGGGASFAYTRFFYTHSANNTVYLLNSSVNPVSFDTLYDFNSTIGNKWRIPPTAACTNSYVTVIDTGHANIQGQNLKWIRLSPTPSPIYTNNGFSGFVYERIGAMQCYPYTLQNACPTHVDAGNGGILYCFSDYQIDSYRHNNYADACDHIYVSQKEFQPDAGQIQVHPNPSNGRYYLSFQASEASKTEIMVSDLTGRALKRFSFMYQQDKQLLDLQELANGTYLITVTQDQQPAYAGKIIKQE